MSSISRRSLIFSAGLAAGGAMLAGCTSGGGSSPQSQGTGAERRRLGRRRQGGDVAAALQRPASLQESPTLKNKGLPCVEQRLPTNPYVDPAPVGDPRQVRGLDADGRLRLDGCRQRQLGVGVLLRRNCAMRLLNDGLDVGPGLADKWTPNADASQWTLHFREGLKWSDGQPFTVDDILFWWEDIVLPGYDGQAPPPSNVSANGKLVTMTKVDDHTLKLSWRHSSNPSSPSSWPPTPRAVWATTGRRGCCPSITSSGSIPSTTRTSPRTGTLPVHCGEQKGRLEAEP